jgi:hypothetical protein
VVRCCRLAAYAGDRSFCIKFNWPFLGAGVVLPKLHYYFMKLALCQCSLPLICEEGTKKKYGDVYVKQIINMFSGLGKERGGCGRGIFQVWLKNS